MLKLDALEVVGFKSFAHKTRLHFPQGITSIVGPNGCGKSNLADAIGWVLGVHSAQNLRGEKMDDVIFNGTRKRKPSGVVEATLVFSHHEGKPIKLVKSGVSGEVLEISRKLYRSGESVYSINQRHCRLKDIRSVMEDAGVGFAPYALIAQGKIGWLLSAKPLERRTVIEEAARIAGYKSRRRSAELKLELAQQNLVRINDIVAEIERQLRSLKRQAAKAKHYKEAREQFRQSQLLKFVFEAEQFSKQIEYFDKALKGYEEKELSVGLELTSKEKAHRIALEKREKLEVKLSDFRQARSKIQLEVDRAQNSIQYHKEQICASENFLESNEVEQKTIKHSLQRVKEELSGFELETSDLLEQKKQGESSVEDQARVVDRHQIEVRESEDEIEELRSRLVRLAADTATLNNLKSQLLQTLEAVQPVLQRLEEERLGHELKLEESWLRLEKVQQALECKKTEVVELGNTLQKQRGEKNVLERRLEELRSESVELHNQLIAQRERLQYLQEVEFSHSQYSEGVQNFLNHPSTSQSIRNGGTLAECIETSPEYEKLVEEFLGEELEYILVDSLDEAMQGVSELKMIESGKCTFLTLNSSNGFKKNAGNGFGNGNGNGSGIKGVHGPLADLLKMKPDVHEAFRRALPQRAEAVVVSDLGQAMHLAHKHPENTFVTLAGEAFTPRGLLSSSSAQGQKMGLLSLRRKKGELEERISGLQKNLLAVQAREEGQQEALHVMLKSFDQSDILLRQAEKEVVTLTHQKEQWTGEWDRQKQALRVVGEELKQLEYERKENHEKVREAEEQLNKGNSARGENEQVLSQMQDTLRQLRSELGRRQEHFHLISSERKVLEERRASVQRTLERIEVEKASLEARQQASQSAQNQGEDSLSQMCTALKVLSADLDKNRVRDAEMQDDLQELEHEYANWKQTLPATEKVLMELRNDKSALQDKKAQLDVDRVRLETQLESISEQCLERLQTSLEDASAKVDLQDAQVEEALQQYEQLRERLEKFGPINMAALEEYQENEERHNFLCSQRSDIELSIADTSKAIKEINRHSCEKFQEAFESINGHFDEIFKKLFGGGECGLCLVDKDDPLESGIDIFAQPPGKKLQNVMLLSGGEKAMTVFAFLMALFAYRPSSFCVLDEVDAPLDSANVARFKGLIQQMSEKTQFIVVTHNNQTMEAAEVLYGVTMEEPGVSKIVSVQY
jgi:chromosome segregation protein